MKISEFYHLPDFYSVLLKDNKIKHHINIIKQKLTFTCVWMQSNRTNETRFLIPEFYKKKYNHITYIKELSKNPY